MPKPFHGGAFFEAIGVDFSDLAKSQQVINADVLDAWFDPSPKVIEKIKEYLPFILRTSPPIYAEGLVQTIAEYRGVPEENILVSGGSSDVIFTFLPNMVSREDRVLILDPMYSEYQYILENVIGATILRHELKQDRHFCIDSDALLDDIQKTKPNLVVLVNPNSPTGQYWPKEHVLTLLKAISKDICLVIDETYIEYIDKAFSLEREVVNFNNLAIIKSMSKVYALSGIRVGYLVANTNVIAQLLSVSPPWAVNLAGQIAGVEALKDEAYYQQKYIQTHILREEMRQQLLQIPFLKVYPTAANFFLIQLLDERMRATEIVQKLSAYGIYIRNADSMSTQFKDRFLRIAVKERTQQRQIVEALKSCSSAALEMRT